jgi:TRAP-type C4-dicarboxylate transport system permease large subunit
MFMETVASINLLVPICMPLFAELNINPIHFGIIMCVTLVIGAVTPPFGTVLFVLSSVANISVEKVSRHTIYFLVPLFFALAVINAFPTLSLWLPDLLFGPEIAVK